MQQYIIMGAKGAGNPVGFMGSLSVSHLASIYILTGVQIDDLYETKTRYWQKREA